MRRLNERTLSSLPMDVERPGYDRNAVGAGIVHLGTGAFHRAHQAWYTDAALAHEPGDWMIAGASLRSAAASEQLNPQNGLFTLVTEDDAGAGFRIIGSIRNVHFAVHDRKALTDALSRARIVSLTVTEKGYCRDPESGALIGDHPDIQHDLAHPDEPFSAIGYLVHTCRARRDQGLPGFTVLSCDNIPGNGQATRKLVGSLAGEIDPALPRWIEDNVSFPGTMVDRIVPATTEALRDRVAAHIGLRDEAVVSTEPFSQWVIEDVFAAGRPAWDAAGATMTNNVPAFERMKLRLLNGAHSAIAYLGHLSGHEFVADVMGDHTLRDFLVRMMKEEIAPTVTAPPGVSVDRYIDELLARFANGKLRHRCLQIAMDGSQKLPQRQLGTIEERLADGQPCPRLITAVAAWIVFATGRDLEGRSHDVSDPLADVFRDTLAPRAGNAAALVDAALDINAVFGAGIAGISDLLGRQVDSFYANGVRATIAAIR